MRTIFIIILSAWSYFAIAQYPIGHRSITYNDPSRSRDILTEVYYPGTSTGENVPVASGFFPVVVFGHGFLMAVDAYYYFKNAIVPLGYIVAFPTTESGASPNHGEFGADLAFLITMLQSENSNSGSPFFQKIAAESAVIGHSMGGGSSFLACENISVPTCMITFAAANTTPSSISAATNTSIPSMVISGAVDCVAPPSSHQIPMYDSLASTCKIYLSIIDGCHCYFGDYNFMCTLGESTCMPVPPLSRSLQQDVALDFTIMYFDYYLKGNSTSWYILNDSLSSSNRISYQISCPITSLLMNDYSAISIYPNPANNQLYIRVPNSDGNLSWYISNMEGVFLKGDNRKIAGSNQIIVDISGICSGVYLFVLKNQEFSVVKKFVISR